MVQPETLYHGRVHSICCGVSKKYNVWGCNYFEEMAELQKELCKHARGKENRAQIAEEIADVQIMLEQMELLHDCEGLVAGFKAQKLDRLEKRLREG